VSVRIIQGDCLEPFAGTGTTLLAADRLQFNAVAIEQSAEYVADIRRRMHRDAGLFAEVA
jgi:DNA modification methylase